MDEKFNLAVNCEADSPTVSGRDLHEALEIKTPYKDWFPRMCEYGFESGVDFNPLKIERVQYEGGRAVTRTVLDHQITIDMAKQLCMIQRSQRGKACREYFLEIERQWNSPEAVMARALQLANKQLELLKKQNQKLITMNKVKDQQLQEQSVKVSYFDIVINCKDLLPISAISKDYGWSAQQMNNWLHAKGIQYKQGGIWLLYQKYASCGYTSTKTHVYTDNNGEKHSKVMMQWTQKGRLFIYDEMKKDGYLPLIEKETSVAELPEYIF